MSELFCAKAGLKMTHIPYRGTALAVADVVAGQVTMVFGDPVSVLPHMQAGTLRAIAVSSPQRSPVAPQVPTMTESGYPGVEAVAWHGIFVPARTAQAIVDRLNAEMAKALRVADIREVLSKQAMEPVGNTQQEFAALSQEGHRHVEGRRDCSQGVGGVAVLYDYIVVGAGSAGAVVANRLSADPRHKVLLLEAGPADYRWTRIPVGSARMIINPAVNWLYSAEPEANTKGRRIAVPRGRMLGGSSALNGMAFVRGQAQDFDTWAQMGNQGWAYEDVLPFFKRLESYDGGGDDTFRGRDGPLRVTNPEPREPFFAAVIKAAGEVGIAHNPDYNGARQDGIAMSQATIARGRRQSTARAYLDPARKRQNLRIETGAVAEALLFEGKRCTGVRYAIGGEKRDARAAREVVVSGGTINSPQLLELSGIGQPDRLRALGIEVRHALAGVGENLREHYAPRTRWAIGTRGITYNDTARGLGLVRQALRYALSGRGYWAALGRRCAPSCARARAWPRPTCCWAGCRC